LIKDRIKKARTIAAITQEDMAKSLNIGKRTFIDYENGVSEPKASTLLGIAEKCNIDISWLLTGKGSMRNDESISVVATHNSIAVGHNNSNISINTASFDHGHEIKEIVELLQYAPSAFLGQVKERLLEFKKLSQL